MLPGDNRKILTWTLVTVLLCPPVADFVVWSSWRQQLQRVADNVAMSSATAIQYGMAPESIAFAGQPIKRLRLVAPPTIEHPPRAGSYAGRAEAVRVTLVTVRAPFFWSNLFGHVRMTAVSTVALIPNSPSGTRPARVE